VNLGVAGSSPVGRPILTSGSKTVFRDAVAREARLGSECAFLNLRPRDRGSQKALEALEARRGGAPGCLKQTIKEIIQLSFH
jgi:hypothetical protein